LNNAEGTLTVMLNDGAGGLVTRAPLLVGSLPWSLAAADFNRDGVPDLGVVANTTDVHVLVGNGDGTFQSTPTHPTLNSGAARAIVAGDFDHDGAPDLIVASISQPGGALLLGNGDATFSGASFALASGRFLTNEDLDGDGEQDLVILRPERDQLAVLRGSATGSFQLESTQLVGHEPVWATLGDFNNDGFTDVATANQGNPHASIPSGSVSMLLGAPTGFYTPSRTMFGEYVMPAFVADDFDVDGHLDLAVAQQESPGGYDVKMLLGNGNGGFLPVFKVGGLGAVGEMRSGDFNRDGLPDLAVTDVGAWGPNLAIFMGTGGGSFARSVRHDGNGAGPYSLTLNDFNADGLSDLAIATRSYMGVDVYLGTASGSFSEGYRYIVGGGPRSIVSADFNRDRNVDIATANETSNSVSVILGQGNGIFSPKRDVAVGTAPVSLAVADLNADLFPDLVTANEGANTLTVLLGRSGGFAPAITVPLATTPRDVKLVDITMDGKIDVLVGLVNGRVLLLKGNADGTFADPVFFSAANSTRDLAPGQFDGDGRLDVAVLGAGVSVLRNVCAP
jgi:hypothetical protein